MNASYNSIHSLLAVILLTVTTIAAHAKGTGHGGGGGYVQNPDGSLIMRDFIKNGDPKMVSDNLSFVKQIPKFNTLIDELITAHPQFALLLIKEYASVVTIWTTDAALPVLPDSETLIVGPKVDVQAATRYGNDIVISLPAFHKGQVEEYFLLHEALHGVIGGTGAIHHMYVRNVVDYIKENRGKLNSVALHEFLIKNKANVPDPEPAAVVRLQQILKGNIQDPLTCAYTAFSLRLQDSLKSNLAFGFFYARDSFVVSTANAWRDLSSCKKDDDLDYIAAKFPNLSRFIENNPMINKYFSAPYVHSVSKPTGWYISSSKKSDFKSSCADYAGEKIKLRLTENRKALNNTLDILNAAKEDLLIIQSNKLSDAENYFFKLFMNDLVPHREDIIKHGNWYLTHIKRMTEIDTDIQKMQDDLNNQTQAEEKFKENLTVCSQ